MNARLSLVVFVGVLYTVYGQVPSGGGCPKVDTVKEFDLNQVSWFAFRIILFISMLLCFMIICHSFLRGARWPGG